MKLTEAEAWTAKHIDNLVVRAVKAEKQRDELLLAVKMLVEEKVDYMQINLLGDPEKQHTIKFARAAIAKIERPRHSGEYEMTITAEDIYKAFAAADPQSFMSAPYDEDELTTIDGRYNLKNIAVVLNKHAEASDNALTETIAGLHSWSKRAVKAEKQRDELLKLMRHLVTAPVISADWGKARTLLARIDEENKNAV